jgi:hypothetical protein
VASRYEPIPSDARPSRSLHKTTYAAVDAILRIKLRDGHDDAIRSLIDLQPDSVRPKLLNSIFERNSSIETGLLTECLGHRDAEDRRMAVSLLREHHTIDASAIDRLLLDPDAGVRSSDAYALRSWSHILRNRR